MKTIFKYPLSWEVKTDVEMPRGAKILKVGVQKRQDHPLVVGEVNISFSELHVWAEIDTDAESETRTFCIVGTGQPLPTDGDFRHLDTLLFDSGFVWHFYERLGA